MFGGRLTQSTLHALDWLAAKTLSPEPVAPHHQTGRRGEEDAYFYLRRSGYTLIARNYRSPNHRGEIDLIGWHRNVLCFIEVKTRSTRDVKPAEAAVDRAKQKELRLVARDFLRHMPNSGYGRFQSGTRSEDDVLWRFDVIAVYYDRGRGQPTFELFQNAFSVSYNRGFSDSH